MIIHGNINYRNKGYEEFESTAKIVFTPYSFTDRATYGSSTTCEGTNSDGTNTFTVDMRADLGSGYTNYTTDHFSNFSVSSVKAPGCNSGYASGLWQYSYKYHKYIPSTGKLNVYVYGHTGNNGYISTVDMTIKFTIIHLEQ